MGILRSIGGIFVEYEKEGATDEGTSTPKKVTQEIPITHTSGVSAGPDASLIKRLEEGLKTAGAESCNTLFEIFDSMADEIADPAARLRASLKVVKRQGITTDAVLGDLGKLEQVLKEKEQAFEHDLERQIEREIAGRHSQAEQFDQAAAAKRLEIEKLRKEVVADEESRDRVQAETRAKEHEIEAVKATFIASLGVVQHRLAERRIMISSQQQGKGI